LKSAARALINTAKHAGRLIGLLLLFIVAAVLLAAGINQFDEPLAPETQVWLQAPGVDHDAGNNGYYYLYGFASGSANPHAEGKLQLEQDQSAGEALKVIGTPPKCPIKNGPCLDYMLSHASDYQQAVANNQPLLKRYEALIAYSGFEEKLVSMDTLPTPGYGPAMASAKLYLAQTALDIAASKQNAADHLLKHLSFWIKAEQGSYSLISLMVATAQLQQATIVTKELLAHYPAQLAGQRPALLALLKARSQRSTTDLMAHAMRGEYFLAANLLKIKADADSRQTINEADDQAIPSWLGRLLFKGFYQQHATLNRMRAVYADQLRSAKHACSASDYLQPINPIGKFMVCDMFDPTSYADRLSNTQRMAAELAKQLENTP
jgi:hypothetical protein